ncbi:MAG: aminoacetone oxidase family FAD-binding enzyme, partial [Clostridia bacterium]|nr:aminoacetone oxidase family FAD-binding enzyme [Clostridia bacterium]
HTIVEVKPALCGLTLPDERLKKLQGLSLKNVALTAKRGGKILFNGFGEMLFTHFGISGPLVLSLSSLINRTPLNDVILSLDLKPALDAQTLDKRILRDFEKYKNKQISNALCELLPQKLIGVVLSFAKINETKNVNVLTKEERVRLVDALKNLPIKLQSLRGFEEAIVTSGGVELTEINPKTMESKKVKGLKFCGEVLDVDAFTGGFNMQIAFSTGYAAGNTVEN